MIIVIGPSNSGKSLLLKRLDSHVAATKGASTKVRKSESSTTAAADDEREQIPMTIPTIGTNVQTTTYRKHPVTFKELGGSMAPIWKSSYKDAEKIIFVIDVSNPSQITSSSVLLRQAVEAEDLKQVPILLVLNKIDGFSTISHSEMKYLIGIDDIIINSQQTIKTVETSAKYGSGVDEIVSWIWEQA